MFLSFKLYLIILAFMSKDSLFPRHFSCLHPKRVVDSHGNVSFYPCGRCKACKLHRASELRNLCELERSSSKYCIYQTLTYNDSCIPLFKFSLDADSSSSCFDVYNLIDVNLKSSINKYSRLVVTDDMCHLGSIKVPVGTSPYSVLPPGSKTISNYVPFLRKRDVQLWFKRVSAFYRKNGIKSPIRFFITGEYGPTTFRPHFHCLLFFDDPRILSLYSDMLSATWQLCDEGKADNPHFHRPFELVSGGACSYVSDYVSEFGMSSVLYDLSSIRPFHSHSKFFGVRYFQKLLQQCSISEFTRFSSTVISRKDFSIKVASPRSFIRSFFPKCYKFNELSFIDRSKVYKFKSFIDKYYRDDCSIFVALWRFINDNSLNVPISVFYRNLFDVDSDSLDNWRFSPSEWPDRHSAYFARYNKTLSLNVPYCESDVSSHLDLNSQNPRYVLLMNRLYNAYLCSKRFLFNSQLFYDDLKSHFFNLSSGFFVDDCFDLYLHVISDFYCYRDYLVFQTYMIDYQYFSYVDSNLSDLFTFNGSSLDLFKIFKSSNSFSKFNNDVNLRFSRKIKKRKLNDLSIYS